MSKRSKQRITGTDTVTTITEYVVTIICLAIIVFVPLYMKNAFYGIGECKYDTYFIITAIGLSVLAVLAVAYFICERKSLSFRWVKERISIVDIAVLIYLLCVLISYVCSDYKSEAWMGYSGWNMGLYSQLTFVVLYFFVSRFGKDYKMLLTVLCVVSAIVFALGVLNRFLIDPLGVYEGLAEHYKLQFLSTLGQSSWYSSFVCTVMPVGIYFFFSSEKKEMRILSGIYTCFAFATLVTQNSDSAYIALFVMMSILLVISITDFDKLLRFLQICIAFFVICKLMHLGMLVFDDTIMIQLDKLSLSLIRGNTSLILLIFFVALYAVLYGFRKKITYPVSVFVKVRYAFIALICVGIVVAVTLVFLSNRTDLPPFIQNLIHNVPYLKWNDSWGNNRGFSWRVTWQMFTEMSLKDKLLGVGPECYPHYAYESYKDVLDTMWGGRILSNAHNEWFNAMINYGVIGAVSYLGLFVTAIVSFAKKIPQNGLLTAVILCTAAYVGHNLFCYQQVLCTPFVFILMGIGSKICADDKGAIKA